MARKYFGTDGIRGRVGDKLATPDFFLKLGWAAGKVLKTDDRHPILIGKDTRLSGYMFESALEAGLSAAGAYVCLLGPIPTPGVAYLTKSTRARAGIVISASHNPYQDNGIKFFDSNGLKISQETELAIEAEIGKPITIRDSSLLGKAGRIEDAPRRYIEFCKSKVAVDLSGLRLVVDCAHGATYHIAPIVFSELGADVVSIGIKPDGCNINKQYGATSPKNLQAKVIEKKADLGIGLDGDGDRIIMVDSKGELLDGDQILFIISANRLDFLNGGIVGTVMSNFGLEQAIKNLQLDFFRSDVGDRHVAEMLREKKLLLGGETSGHVINLDVTTTGDGIISALRVLEAMIRQGKSLYDLKSGMEKYPQKIINLEVLEKVELEHLENVQKAVESVKKEVGSNGRVWLRYSGTEPLLRIMVEGDVEDKVDMQANYLANVIKTSLNSKT